MLHGFGGCGLGQVEAGRQDQRAYPSGIPGVAEGYHVCPSGEFQGTRGVHRSPLYSKPHPGGSVVRRGEMPSSVHALSEGHNSSQAVQVGLVQTLVGCPPRLVEKPFLPRPTPRPRKKLKWLEASSFRSSIVFAS